MTERSWSFCSDGPLEPEDADKARQAYARMRVNISARAVYCTTCGRRKKPVGRDSLDSGLCSHDCPGYREQPLPGHLWPGETE